MARTKRKINPILPEAEAPAPAQKKYRTAAYVRLSVVDSGKPGADTIEGQKNLLLHFIENDQSLTLYGLFCEMCPPTMIQMHPPCTSDAP